MKKQVLLIGSSGYIGKAVKEELLGRESYELLTASRSSGDYKVDITDTASVSQLPDVDIVINAAGRGDVNGLEKDLSVYDTVNVEGVKNLSERYSDTRLIHISSLAALGLSKSFYSDDAVPEPELPYSVTKFRGEKAVEENFEDYVIIRPAEVFDAESPPHLLEKTSRFGLIPTNDCKTLGVQRTDLAKAIEGLLDSERTHVNVGEPHLPEKMAELSGLRGRRVFLPNFFIKTAGFFGEILRKLGFRTIGAIRADSITRDKNIETGVQSLESFNNS